MNKANQQIDETTQTINEILQCRYENKVHCPYFSINNGVCTLKSQKYKPYIYWQDSHSKGTKSTRFYEINKYHGTIDCDSMYKNEEQSYFDCILIQDFKPHQCILEKDLNQTIDIISKEVFKEYGITPKQIPLEKIFKTIRRIKTSITKEMITEFQRWIVVHYEIVKKNEDIILVLKTSGNKKKIQENTFERTSITD